MFPPDQVDFLAGQYFDIRLEVHAPVNGSEATGNPTPDPNFTFTIARGNAKAQPASSFLGIAEPALERWNFTYYEGTLLLQYICAPIVLDVFCYVRFVRSASGNSNPCECCLEGIPQSGFVQGQYCRHMCTRKD